MGNNRELTLLTLRNYEPATIQAITVFELDQCHGYSARLWEDQVYNDTETQLTLGRNIRSVMVPEGTDWQVDLYSTKDFVEQEVLAFSTL